MLSVYRKTTPGKISVRLAVNAAGWVIVSLLTAGLLLNALFQFHLERDFDRLIQDHLEEVSAISMVDGQPTLIWAPADSHFRDESSGWYWQIQADGKPLLSSLSLGEKTLPLPAMTTSLQAVNLSGPNGRQLKMWVQKLDLRSPTGATLLAAVAAPRDEMAKDIAEFSIHMGLTLGVIGVGLIIAAFFQIHFGLAPLRRLSIALNDIRTGREARFPETFPLEVLPMVQELNALLDHNQALLERARGHVADMAHTLRNPLSVIRYDIHNLEGETAQRLARQVDSVIATIEQQLARSRSAGTGNLLNSSTDVADVVEDLRYSLERLYQDRALQFHISGITDLRFRGDRQDLEEMLGAILDNACKFAYREITIFGDATDEWLTLTVSDDGVGLAKDLRESLPKRGLTLDSTRSGTGLGLSIAADLAELYGGTLTLDESSSGGLSVIITLPACRRLLPRESEK